VKQAQTAARGDATDGSTQFQRFEALGRRLFAVPKKELDAKLESDRARRTKLKTGRKRKRAA